MLQNLLTLMFSLCVHSSIIVVAILLSYNTPAIPETVYRVSLAEFAVPSPVEVTQPDPPKPAPPKPEPPKPVPKIEPKAISAKKRANVPKKVVEKPQPPPPPVVPQQVQTGPRSTNYGGIQAYKEDVVDQRPSIARGVSPTYPSRARRMNIQGQVVVRLIVDTSGTAQQCIVHSSNPKDVFDEAALKAARKTRFIPGQVKGHKVNTVVLIPYKFTLC